MYTNSKAKILRHEMRLRLSRLDPVMESARPGKCSTHVLWLAPPPHPRAQQTLLTNRLRAWVWPLPSSDPAPRAVAIVDRIGTRGEGLLASPAPGRERKRDLGRPRITPGEDPEEPLLTQGGRHHHRTDSATPVAARVETESAALQ